MSARPKINSKDVFSAIIRGSISVAHDGPFKPFSYLTAVSASGRCTLHLLPEGSSGILGFSLGTFSGYVVKTRH